MCSVATVNVTNSQELSAALKAATGGETLVLEAGNYGDLSISTRWLGHATWEETVTIVSADMYDQAIFETISLDHVSNLKIDSVGIDTPAATSESQNVIGMKVGGSDGVTIANSSFLGRDAIVGDEHAIGYAAGTGLSVRDSANITVENNQFSTWRLASVFRDSENIRVSGNEFTDMRVDAMNNVGVNGIEIDGNWFHDFRMSPDALDHRDMIQFWTTNSTTPNANIEIHNNLFDIGAGAPTQSIFMRNEAVDGGDAGKEMYYKNVHIHDNVIYNEDSHGITVGESDGLVIENNLLVAGVAADGVWSTGAPGIRVASPSTDVTVTGNVAEFQPNPADNPDWTLSEGQEGSLDASMLITAEMASKDHLTLALDAPDYDKPITDVLWLMDGEYIGEGDEITATVDSYGQHVAEVWTVFDDGTAELRRARLSVDDPVRLGIAAVNGEMEVVRGGEDAFDPSVMGDMTVTTAQGAALDLEGDSLHFERGSAMDLSELDAFYFGFSLMADGAHGAGDVIRQHMSFRLNVTEGGEASFALTDSAGASYSLATVGADLLDGEWHDVGVGYDSELGLLAILVDGEAMAYDVIEGGGASMVTTTSWAPMMGELWGADGFDGLVSQIEVVSESPWDQSDLQQFVNLENGGAGEPVDDEASVLRLAFESDGSIANLTGSAPFEQVDLSAGIEPLQESGAALRLSAEGLTGFNTDRFAADVFAMEDFDFGFNMKADAGGSGEIFRIHGSMQLEMTSDGDVYFKMYDQNMTKYELETDGLALIDDEWHEIQMLFDGDLNSMAIAVDGEVEAFGYAPDIARQKEYWGPSFGSTYGSDGFDGLIGEIDLQRDEPELEIPVAHAADSTLLLA